MIFLVAEDFEYDGEYLKDWGCMICCSDSPSGFDTIDSDSQRSFNTVSQFNGKEAKVTTSTYEDHIELNFQICKFSCKDGVTPFHNDETREMKRWLNRPTIHKFKLIQPGWHDIYMEGSFNVSNVELNGLTYMLDLTFISNRPLALHEPIIFEFDSTNKKSVTFFDISDEIGYIYPDVEITCLESGTLQINNSNEDRITEIKNCQKGEIITFSKDLLMYSSIPSHKIQNDFNYKFFRISNSWNNRKNIITFSKSVKFKFTYSPYVKAVM